MLKMGPGLEFLPALTRRHPGHHAGLYSSIWRVWNAPAAGNSLEHQRVFRSIKMLTPPPGPGEPLLYRLVQSSGPHASRLEDL